VAAVVFLAESPEAVGPYNLCCLETPTNAEFTKALSRAVGRPAVLPVPGIAIRVGAGRMSPELLGSVNASPRALLDAGFEFHDPDVTAVLAAGLARG
jgi:NAD dependent epimerase/dehydratase family enzyme